MGAREVIGSAHIRLSSRPLCLGRGFIQFCGSRAFFTPMVQDADYTVANGALISHVSMANPRDVSNVCDALQYSILVHLSPDGKISDDDAYRYVMKHPRSREELLLALWKPRKDIMHLSKKGKSRNIWRDYQSEPSTTLRARGGVGVVKKITLLPRPLVCSDALCSSAVLGARGAASALTMNRSL